MTKKIFRWLVGVYLVSILLIILGYVVFLSVQLIDTTALEHETQDNALLFRILSALLGIANPAEDETISLISLLTDIGLFLISCILLMLFSRWGPIAFATWLIFDYVLYTDWTVDPFGYGELGWPSVVFSRVLLAMELWIFYLVWISPFSSHFANDKLVRNSEASHFR